MKQNRITHIALVAVLAAFAAFALAACGGGGGEDNGGDETASSDDIARYEKDLDAVYEGTFEPPTGPSVKAPTGQNVWLITNGQNIEPAQNFSAAVKSAGDKLDWNITVFDGKFESSRWLTGIQQALADQADGIIVYGFDCAPVKTGLEQAKNAGVPVVLAESRDCEPSLSSYALTFVGGMDFQEFIEDGFAGYQARWIVAKTKGQAKTIVTVETDLFGTRIALPGIERVFKGCPTCEIVDVVNFVGTDFGPPLQQKIEQSLNQHPEANSFIAAYDAVMTGGGGAAALRASGRLDELVVMGGEGSAPGIELIYNEAGVEACSGIDYDSEGYGAVMGLVRSMAGQDPYSGDTGIGSQACDLDHNLPPKGEPYIAPIDYLPYYEEMWGLK